MPTISQQNRVLVFAFVVVTAMFLATLLKGQTGYTNVAIGPSGPSPCIPGTFWVNDSTLAVSMCQLNGSSYAQVRPQPTVASASHSIVTGTGATGFQVSATSDARVFYSIESTVTTTIGGPVGAAIVLEVAPTNSATPTDWIEIGRHTNIQTATLAVALQLVQTSGGELSGYVPYAYWAKLRSITTSGSPTYAYKSGREETF